MMTLKEAEQKRAEVVDLALTLIGKNTYSQDTKLRMKVFDTPKGFGDCSSTMYRVFEQVMKITIGTSSYLQAQSKLGVIVDVAKGICPNEKNLKPGDLLFFNYERAKKKSSNWGTWRDRFLHVGHVEMYIGNGKLLGHPSGIGPRIVDMNTYCISMYKSGRTYSIAKRFIYSYIEVAGINPTSTQEGFKDWVKRLQKALKIPVTGYVNAETIQATVTLQKNSNGEIVSLVQERLRDLGYDIGNYGVNKDGVDGKAGTKFVEAINSIQKWINLAEKPDSVMTRSRAVWRFLLQVK